MSSYSENNSFEEILSRLLSKVSNDLDKRQGSIIYDALAPAAAELAQAYIALDVYSDQTYLLNAVGENLDNRVADCGLTRRPATYAQRYIEVFNTSNQLMDIDIGSRFSTPNEYGGINFQVISKVYTGKYVVQAETAGAIGNEYIGELLPLQSINNLGLAKLEDNIKPGENEESDESLKERALAKINQESFAGNKAAYKRLVEDMDGVESCKVFPVWNGGGSVKLAIISANNTIPSEDFIDSLQEKIDPIPNQGEGIGLAPIGHTVTVVAPDKLDINITASITFDENYTLAQLIPSIEQCIADYITEVQDTWSEEDTIIIYTSKLIAAILTVSQVKNVSELKINNQTSDLTIELTGTNVKFPMLNEVTINEG